MQYLFAADRGNPRVADRYDPVGRLLRALETIQRGANRHAGHVCGEMGGRPLEAFALVALGFAAVDAAGRHRPGQADGAVAGRRAARGEIQVEAAVGGDQASLREPFEAMAKRLGVRL